MPRLADGTEVNVLGAKFRFDPELDAAILKAREAAKKRRLRPPREADEIVTLPAESIASAMVINPVAASLFTDFLADLSKRIEAVSKQVIQTAYRVGTIDGYGYVLPEGAQTAEQQVFWMCISDNDSCIDCLDLHGAVMLTSEFQATYMKTRCRTNCRCMPLPVDPEAQVEYLDKYRDVLPLENLRSIGEAVE